MTLAAPLSSPAGQTFVVGLLNLKVLWSLTSELQLGQGGRAYIVDGRGGLIAADDASLVLKRLSFTDRSFVKRLLEDGRPNGVSGLYKNERGIEAMATGLRLDRVGWGVVVEHPRAVVAQAVERKLLFFAVLTLAGILVSAAIGRFLSRRVTRPPRRAALRPGRARSPRADRDLGRDRRAGATVQPDGDGARGVARAAGGPHPRGHPRSGAPPARGRGAGSGRAHADGRPRRGPAGRPGRSDRTGPLRGAVVGALVARSRRLARRARDLGAGARWIQAGRRAADGRLAGGTGRQPGPGGVDAGRLRGARPPHDRGADDPAPGDRRSGGPVRAAGGQGRDHRRALAGRRLDARVHDRGSHALAGLRRPGGDRPAERESLRRITNPAAPADADPRVDLRRRAVRRRRPPGPGREPSRRRAPRVRVDPAGRRGLRRDPRPRVHGGLGGGAPPDVRRRARRRARRRRARRGGRSRDAGPQAGAALGDAHHQRRRRPDGRSDDHAARRDAGARDRPDEERLRVIRDPPAAHAAVRDQVDAGAGRPGTRGGGAGEELHAGRAGGGAASHPARQ